MNQILTGKHECQMSESEEADLSKYLSVCEKNPGHAEFIPVNAFHIDHLPEGHRDNDLFKWIKATADLTIRVDVKMTSPQRPEFWPGTDNPYPFYDTREKKKVRFGSGRMLVYMYIDGNAYDGNKNRDCEFDRIYKYCPCEKCQHSEKRNNVWWEIIVLTASHVVFDDIEASQTSCRLFYDETKSEVVMLDNLTVCSVKIEEDFCKLKHTTCDVILGNRLYHMMGVWVDLWRTVDARYRTRTDERLNFIVSHPHGCTKQVSVGQWVHNVESAEYVFDKRYNKTKLTYTTSTCPGSSGARVYSVGAGGHVHSGAMQSGLNYSGIGVFKK